MEFKGTKGKWFLEDTKVRCSYKNLEGITVSPIIARCSMEEYMEAHRLVIEEEKAKNNNIGVYQLQKSYMQFYKESFKNAQLIAAAPELLQVLINLNKAIDNYWNAGSKIKDQKVKDIEKLQKESFEIIIKATV